MSGLHPGTQNGPFDGTNNRRSDFHVFDDVQSLQDNVKAWADLFACMQQDGESVLQYGNRVIGIAQQLIDIDPALYECLVFHRVKAGLRKPIRDILSSNTVQPNSHAMLDQVVVAIEQKLQATDPAFAIDNLTPRLTPTINGDNVARFQDDDNHNAPAIHNSIDRPANAGKFGGSHQEQPWEHGPTPQEQPFENETRASQATPANNHSDGGPFQIRGLHQTQQPTGSPGAQQQPTQDLLGTARYSPSNDRIDTAPPMLGRHEVQHTANPFKGLKRPGPDGDRSHDDANNQSSRKKVVPWQEFQRRKQHGPIVCHYCHETGHFKNTCPINPQNSSKAQ
ncbi:MAG: hypothetical protein L6R42_000530 [Xanthoria sp. 1 TBL-2021]|nr:MAG: hypothetical protein L6R42_000530 [Xanthoria sp. 1 TBL-2021]